MTDSPVVAQRHCSPRFRSGVFHAGKLLPVKVQVVFPDVPRAVFNTALGWYRALLTDPDVTEIACIHSRGYHGVVQDAALEDLPKLPAADVTLVISGHQVARLFAPPLRLPGRKRALILTDEPYETGRTQSYNQGEWKNTYDVVAVNEAATVNLHREGVFLPCATDPEVIPAYSNLGGEPLWDIGYVGTFDSHRERWFRAIADHNPRARWLMIGPKWLPFRRNRAETYHRRISMRTEPGSGYLSPSEVLGFYSLCRLVLNIHREESSDFPGLATSPNPREYDLIWLGLPHVADARANLPVPELGFKTPSECGQFVEGFLGNDVGCQERMKVALAKSAQIRDEHTYLSRWNSLKAALYGKG